MPSWTSLPFELKCLILSHSISLVLHSPFQFSVNDTRTRQRLASDLIALTIAAPELSDELLRLLSSHTKLAQNLKSKHFEQGPGGRGWRNGNWRHGAEWAEGLRGLEKSRAFYAWVARGDRWKCEIDVCQRARVLWEERYERGMCKERGFVKRWAKRWADICGHLIGH